MNTVPPPADIREALQTSLFASMLAAPAQPPNIAERVGWVIVPCALVTLTAWPMHDTLDAANTAMLYLLAVALIALRAGRVAAIVAALASTALLDFFFIHPRFTFTVGDMQHMITLIVMLVVALIISNLTASLQQQFTTAIERAQQSRALYQLAGRLAGSTSLEQVATVTRQFLMETRGAHGMLLVRRDEALQPAEPAHQLKTALQAAAARAALAQAEVRPLLADLGYWLFLPLPGSTYVRGVLAIDFGEVSSAAISAQQPLYEAIASLVAIALERLHFVEVAQRAQLQMTDERLRSSILAALSHDIRTPLTVLYGMTDALAQQELPASLHDMTVAMREQAMHLNNMVSNLLDMARLRAGNMRLNPEWQPLEEVIGASIKLLGAALAGHPVKISLPPDMPLLQFDAILIERVLCNLLENAAKYAPAGTAINITARTADGRAGISVCDSGPGFPPDKLDKVFDLFERGDTESNIPGVGLGLAICRSIIEAHGGTIRAENHDGACVTFTLPLGEPPAITLDESDD